MGSPIRKHTQKLLIIKWALRPCQINKTLIHFDSIDNIFVRSEFLLFSTSERNLNKVGSTDSKELGLIVIDSAKCKNVEDYFTILGDKTKWDKIIWSNPLYLNK